MPEQPSADRSPRAVIEALLRRNRHFYSALRRYGMLGRTRPVQWRLGMLKFIGGTIGLIFLIGLLVVIGLFALIF